MGIFDIIWGLVQPSSLIFAFYAVGSILAIIGLRRPAIGLFFGGATLYVMFVFFPVANWLVYPFESRAIALTAKNLDGAAGIIVLGGTGGGAMPGMPGLRWRDGADTWVEAARLATRYPSLPVIFSSATSIEFWRKKTN